MTEQIVLIEKLFNEWNHKKPDSIDKLPESGSYRQYYRITEGDRRFIGAYNTDRRENEAFINIGRQLLHTGNRVPLIYTADLENNVYLQEYLGDTTLAKYIEKAGENSNSEAHTLSIYKKVIDAMPNLQIGSTNGMDYSNCYPRAAFDRQSMIWDLNYFKYCLLKPLRIGFYEQDLEDDFNNFINWLLEANHNSFLYRDFQSRNIMYFKNELYFIDFQGGRLGPLQYDLASLLYESHAQLPHTIRETLLDYYLDTFSETYQWFSKDKFMEHYYGFVYLRHMQAMGAYGFRGLTERKQLFLDSLPRAIEILSALIKKHPLPLKLICLPQIFKDLTTISLPGIEK